MARPSNYPEHCVSVVCAAVADQLVFCQQGCDAWTDVRIRGQALRNQEIKWQSRNRCGGCQGTQLVQVAVQSSEDAQVSEGVQDVKQFEAVRIQWEFDGIVLSHLTKWECWEL